MKPILFNTAMVKAIMAQRKTQTRRACKGQPVDGITSPEDCGYKPAYNPGDVLYVRETWMPVLNDYVYYADRSPEELATLKKSGLRWRPSIHMPREAARLFLRVTDVHMERLKDISEEDAKAEGFEPDPDEPETACVVGCEQGSARGHFAVLWNKTLTKDNLDWFRWEANPFVWVYSFEWITPKQAYALGTPEEYLDWSNRQKVNTRQVTGK